MTIILSQSRSDRTWNSIRVSDLFSQAQPKEDVKKKRRGIRKKRGKGEDDTGCSYGPSFTHPSTYIVGPSLSSWATEMCWDAARLTTIANETSFYWISRFKLQVTERIYRETKFHSKSLGVVPQLHAESKKKGQVWRTHGDISSVWRVNCNHFEMSKLFTVSPGLTD